MTIYIVEDLNDILGTDTNSAFVSHDEAVAALARDYLEETKVEDMGAERMVSDLRYLFSDDSIPNYKRIVEAELEI